MKDPMPGAMIFDSQPRLLDRLVATPWAKPVMALPIIPDVLVARIAPIEDPSPDSKTPA